MGLQSAYHQELEEMIGQVQNRVDHSYLHQFVTYPAIDRFQLHFIYLFLRSKGFSKTLREIYCVSYILVQLAIDSHEGIGTEDVYQNKAIKNRQLRILLGDFYCSSYYSYLAEKGQIEIIQQWSNVIQKVNEYKADFHDRLDQLTAEEAFDLKCLIKKQQIEAVLSWCGASTLWHHLFSLFVESKVRIEENMADRSTLQALSDRLSQKISECGDKQMISELHLLWAEIQNKQLVMEQ